MKPSRFDLEELNCWNKNLDVGLDASGCNLDSFLHKTCLVAEFICHLIKSYLPHMRSFFADIWYVDRSLSQESNQIDFVSNGLL
jgi:hypothetical protein